VLVHRNRGKVPAGRSNDLRPAGWAVITQCPFVGRRVLEVHRLVGAKFVKEFKWMRAGAAVAGSTQRTAAARNDDPMMTKLEAGLLALMALLRGRSHDIGVRQVLLMIPREERK
jgi:hypothetical protein